MRSFLYTFLTVSNVSKAYIRDVWFASPKHCHFCGFLWLVFLTVTVIYIHIHINLLCVCVQRSVFSFFTPQIWILNLLRTVLDYSLSALGRFFLHDNRRTFRRYPHRIYFRVDLFLVRATAKQENVMQLICVPVNCTVICGACVIRFLFMEMKMKQNNGKRFRFVLFCFIYSEWLGRRRNENDKMEWEIKRRRHGPWSWTAHCTRSSYIHEHVYDDDDNIDDDDVCMMHLYE